MGYYINPPAMTKTDFLEKHGTRTNDPGSFDFDSKELSLVCLVQNPAFSAAAICYSLAEYQAFSLPSDLRPKIWFIVPRSALYGNADIPHTWEKIDVVA